MLPHSAILSRFWANQSLLFLFNAACLSGEATNTNLIIFGLTRSWPVPDPFRAQTHDQTMHTVWKLFTKVIYTLSLPLEWMHKQIHLTNLWTSFEATHWTKISYSHFWYVLFFFRGQLFDNILLIEDKLKLQHALTSSGPDLPIYFLRLDFQTSYAVFQ